MSKKKKAIKISLIVVNVLLLIGLSFSSVFYFMKYRNLKNSSLSSDQRITKYEKEIAKTYALPTGEKPTLYDVTQADSLKKDGPNKDFFKDSQNGDVLLLYGTAKIGVLYRPAEKKIIKVGPAAVTQQTATELIGAKTERDAAKKVLTAAFAASIAISKEADAKEAIAATIVVDVTGKNADAAAAVAKELKGTVGEAPAGQDEPADGTGLAVYLAPTTP